jgi:hypothetical protein
LPACITVAGPLRCGSFITFVVPADGGYGWLVVVTVCRCCVPLWFIWFVVVTFVPVAVCTAHFNALRLLLLPLVTGLHTFPRTLVDRVTTLPFDT